MTSITATLKTKDFRTEITCRQHQLIADEPESLGGSDMGPTPTELLCSALASCTAITLKMYLNRKEWAVGSIHVDVSYDKQAQFTRAIAIKGQLSDQQTERILKIANACPVHKILESANTINTSIKPD